MRCAGSPSHWRSPGPNAKECTAAYPPSLRSRLLPQWLRLQKARECSAFQENGRAPRPCESLKCRGSQSKLPLHRQREFGKGFLRHSCFIYELHCEKEIWVMNPAVLDHVNLCSQLVVFSIQL